MKIIKRIFSICFVLAFCIISLSGCSKGFVSYETLNKELNNNDAETTANPTTYNVTFSDETFFTSSDNETLTLDNGIYKANPNTKITPIIKPSYKNSCISLNDNSLIDLSSASIVNGFLINNEFSKFSEFNTKTLTIKKNTTISLNHSLVKPIGIATFNILNNNSEIPNISKTLTQNNGTFSSKNNLLLFSMFDKLKGKNTNSQISNYAGSLEIQMEVVLESISVQVFLMFEDTNSNVYFANVGNISREHFNSSTTVATLGITNLNTISTIKLNPIILFG